MDPHHLTSRLVELVSYAVLLVAVTIVAHPDPATGIRLFGVQGLLLGLLSAVVAAHTGSHHLLGVAALAVVVKGFAIPIFLLHVMRRIGLAKGAERSLSVPASLIGTGVLTLFAHHVSRPVAHVSPWLTRDLLASSLATVLIGLLLMITCRKALTQMLGFLIMEDGIFLFAITETHGMPLLVELGVFFDLMVAVAVTGILLLRISGTFNHIDVGQLDSLKG
jgi:hydrogenase-4 component E